MSPVEIKGESSPKPPGQLKDAQTNDEGVGDSTEMKNLGPNIDEAAVESYYRQSGSNLPKPPEAKPPAAQD